VFEVSVPTTATWEPTVTLEKLGAVTPRSRYVVVLLTFTVTTVPLREVSLKVFVPSELTVPRAAGRVPKPYAKWWPPKPPTRTLVAATVFEVSVPTTATWEPTVTLEKLGAVTPRSRYVVVLLTFTVTTVPLREVSLKVFVPSELTVPRAAGRVPSK
jgi:uncharacterized membrane protein